MGAGSPWEIRAFGEFLSLDWEGSLFLSLFSYVPCSNIYDRASLRMGNSVPHLPPHSVFSLVGNAKY